MHCNTLRSSSRCDRCARSRAWNPPSRPCAPSRFARPPSALLASDWPVEGFRTVSALSASVPASLERESDDIALFARCSVLARACRACLRFSALLASTHRSAAGHTSCARYRVFPSISTRRPDLASSRLPHASDELRPCPADRASFILGPCQAGRPRSAQLTTVVCSRPASPLACMQFHPSSISRP